MNFRNDLACKNKWKFDMEGAALRYGTHPGTNIYICTNCGFAHFSYNEFSRIDRIHEKELVKEANRLANTKEARAKVRVALKPKPIYEKAMPKVFLGVKTTARVPVWFASGCSIGEQLAQKKSHQNF
jgi:hypothetical protein